MTHERTRANAGRPTAARALAAILLLATVACAPNRLVLPSGPGAPTTEFQAPFDQASTACRAVRTMRATIRLAGRAGGQRMRGTLIAGLARPNAVRLEGVAPFGPPAFILAAHDESATLLFPRDNRVLTGVSAADILDALAPGVRLAPAALGAILSGCVVPDPQPAAGRVFDKGGPARIGDATKGDARQRWLAVEVGRGATAYLLQQQGQWRIVAGVLPELEVWYDQFEGGLPRGVQIRSRAAQAPAIPLDLTLALSDLSTNVTLNASVFEVDVPRDAAPLTLAELRESGPLGVKEKGRGSTDAR